MRYRSFLSMDFIGLDDLEVNTHAEKNVFSLCTDSMNCFISVKRGLDIQTNRKA